MASYVSLFNFTANGAENFRQSPSRPIPLANSSKKASCKVREIYWTVGQCDGVLIFEAASDEAAASVLLSLAALGNVRTTTLRAFTAAEMKGIVAKAPKL